MDVPEGVPPHGDAHKQVVGEMVSAYARFVERGLLTMPESLTWGAVLKYLRQPALGSLRAD